MPGLVPAIHVLTPFEAMATKTWYPAQGRARGLALFRVEPAVDAGRADIVPHEGTDAVAPWIAVAGARPFGAFRHRGVLELVERQGFRLAVDRRIPARVDAAGALQIGRDIRRIVPVVELLLDHRRDVDPPHLQKRRRLVNLLDRVAVDRKDLAIAVEQVIAADLPPGRRAPPRRRPEPNAVEKRWAAQYVRRLELVEREIFRAALQRDIAAGAQKAGHRQQMSDVLLIIPAVIFGLEFGIDIGPYHQQAGAARLGHIRLPLLPGI